MLGTRRTERLETLADELRAQDAQVATVTVDVTQPGDLARLVDTAVDVFGRVDVLVSTGGFLRL